MAMNKQRKTSNLLNILSYDDAGNIVLRDYSQTIRYNWNGTIHAFTGPLSVSSIAAAVTDTDRFLVSDGGVLKYRTGAEVLSDIGAIGGSGVAGQVAYWNGTSSQTGSNNLFWDNVNARLGIGTNTPSRVLHVIGDALFQSTGTGDGTTAMRVNNSAGTQILAIGAGGGIIMNFSTKISTTASPTTAQPQLELYNSGTGNATLQSSTSYGLLLNPNGGNIVLGSTTNGTQRLQVYGDAFIKGSGATSATNALLVQNSAGTNLLRVQNNGIVSIGDGPADTLSNNGDVILKLNSSFQYWTIQNRQNAGLEFLNQNYAGGYSFFTLTDARNTSSSQTNALFQRFFTQNSVNNRTFINVELRGDINQTGGATGISRGLYLNHTLIAAADWRSIEWSNNSGWGLYGAGTANNYLNGRLGIGTTTTSTGILSIGANLTGGTTQRIAYIQTTIQSDVTGTAYGIQSAIGTAGTSFTLSDLFHYQSSQASFGGGSVVTSQYGFAVSNNLIGATNNYGFFGNIPNGTNRWNLYMAGTADNYLAGKLLINTTTVGTFNLDVNGTARVSGNTEISAGNLSIFTTNTPRRLNIEQALGGVAAAIGLYAGGGTLNSVIGIDNEATKSLQLATTGNLIFYSGSTIGNIVTTPTNERMRLTSGGNLLVGTTVDQGYRVQITSASADSQLNVWGATSPSIRLDNAASGATQRFVIGLATATNNFIQGANAGDVCMTPGTSSALVFGMWQTSSSSEVMRISTSSNVLIGTSTDVGAKLRVVGDISASVDLRLTRTGTSPAIILDQTQLRLVNQTSGFTIGLNVENDIIRFGGAIRTTPPAGSGNPEYKLGSYSATAPTATGYLNIEVGGVVYKVLAST